MLMPHQVRQQLMRPLDGCGYTVFFHVNPDGKSIDE